MPRKSARILSKNCKANKDVILTINNKKRKAEEDPEVMTQEKRGHFQDMTPDERCRLQVENQWLQISSDASFYNGTVIPTCRQVVDMKTRHRHVSIDDMTSQFRRPNFFTAPSNVRPCPLPKLDWAHNEDVWKVMIKKDELYVRNQSMLDSHPQLQTKMRAILLDWLVEVCEVYRLMRDSFYLAVDLIDRYLSVENNIGKDMLQLLGITALFIAAKTEEIYPPKLSDFSYVTDEACSEEEILDMELVVLKKLKWDLCPVTSVQWMNLFLQLMNTEQEEQDSEDSDSFILPQYSAHFYVQLARLLDLVMLDIESLQFSYGVLAACAICHLVSDHVAISVSGYTRSDLAACADWMLPFAMVVEEMGGVELKFYNNVSPEMTHFIQTRTVDLSILEHVNNKKVETSMSRSSPDIAMQIDVGMLTPPQSSKKSQG